MGGASALRKVARKCLREVTKDKLLHWETCFVVTFSFTAVSSISAMFRDFALPSSSIIMCRLCHGNTLTESWTTSREIYRIYENWFGRRASPLPLRPITQFSLILMIRRAFKPLFVWGRLTVRQRRRTCGTSLFRLLPLQLLAPAHAKLRIDR